MCKKCDDIITCAGSGQHLRVDRIRIIKVMPVLVASGTLCINTSFCFVPLKTFLNFYVFFSTVTCHVLVGFTVYCDYTNYQRSFSTVELHLSGLIVTASRPDMTESPDNWIFLVNYIGSLKWGKKIFYRRLYESK